MHIFNIFTKKYIVSFFIILSMIFLSYKETNIIYDATDNKNLNKKYVTSYSTAVKKSAPAVVSIQTTQEIPFNMHPMLNDPIFRFFFGDPQDQGNDQKFPNQNKQFQQGLGSGVIVDEKGYVLTNNHVIKDANSIIIKLSDGRTSDAEIIGADPKTDLAILKIKQKDLIKNIPIISLGSSDNLNVGDIVLAIGNPFGFDNTVTQGIVSAMGSISARSNDPETPFVGLLDNLIQTDAAINPGNSGGALIDAHGNLIGINMAIISRSGGSQGIGFAIPIDLAKDIMKQLIETGHIIRGWLGIYLVDVSKEIRKTLNFTESNGVYIQAVIRNSPAQKAGLLPGDIITKVNNKEIKNGNDAINLITNLIPGKNYTIDVYRKGEFLSFSVLITQSPKEN